MDRQQGLNSFQMCPKNSLQLFGKLGPAEIWALNEKNGKLGSKILGAVHFGRRSEFLDLFNKYHKILWSADT